MDETEAQRVISEGFIEGETPGELDVVPMEDGSTVEVTAYGKTAHYAPYEVEELTEKMVRRAMEENRITEGLSTFVHYFRDVGRVNDPTVDRSVQEFKAEWLDS